MNTICGDETMSDLYKLGDCVHGIGHAMMYLNDYDIPSALEYCELLEKDSLKYYCATGAYMEYIANYDEEESKTKSLLYPCDKSDYPAACFRYKMFYVMLRQYQRDGSLNEIVDACEQLEGKYRLGCFHGIGNALMEFIILDQLPFAKVCGFGTHDDQYMCIEGAIERMAKYHPNLALKQCEELSGWHKDLCIEGANRQMYSLDKSFELYMP